jgi:coenzyme F420-0:L-glutamate ligase/coenzyme F420-1:gamma-L-glutamate ligase
MSDGLEVLPVRGIGDVRPGADLAAFIAEAAPWLRDGDVLVVTSKVISKAEGRLVDVPAAGPAREAAREEHLAAETARPVARRGHTRIVQTHHGFVLASAGIDASNVDRSQLVLLPKDPDASARSLRAALRERCGVNLGVVISDTMGRPWRNGLVDVALGTAGVEALRDHRGEIDPYGNELHITQMAVFDELASAAELVKGKCDQVPVAVVRGLSRVRAEDGPGAAVLVRAADQDLFSLGTAEARQAGLREAAELADAPCFAELASETGPSGGPLDEARTDAAVAAVLARLPVPAGTRARLLAAADLAVRPDVPAHTRLGIAATVDDEATDPTAAIALGTWLHRVRCALAAEDLASIWLPATGVLAVGAPPAGTLSGR